MFIPQSYASALAFLIVSMIAWGSWANAQKFDQTLRFELFYWDYVAALVVCAVIAGLTLGRLHGSDPDSFFHNLHSTRWPKVFEAFAGGVVFNAGNILLVAAIALGGMAVAFPIAAGLGLVIGAALNYVIRPAGNVWLLFVGVGLICVAIVLDAVAYRSLDRPRTRVKRAIVLSLAAGVLIGLFYPFVAKALGGVGRLTPYTVLAIFALGVVFSNVPFNILLMKHPVTGFPLAGRDYFELGLRRHALGWIAGAIWTVGTVANFAASWVSTVGPAISFALGEGNTLISAVWGILIWREFRGARTSTRWTLALMFVCFAVGLTAIALAPVWM